MFIIWSLKATVWVCSLAHSIQMIWWVCRFDINQGQSPHSRHQCTLLAEALVIIPLVTAMVLHAYHSRVHLNTHSREHFHKCEQCDFAFLIQEIWGGIWKRTVGKRQTNATIVTQMKTHSGEKVKQWNQCDYVSSDPSTLRTHLKRQSGDKSNKFNQCDYASSLVGNLRTHLKMHSGEKSKKCNQCDYASSLAGNLRMHLKTHSGEKLNKCNHCVYIFSQAGNLKRHLITHSGVKSNNCSQCDYACSQAGFEHSFEKAQWRKAEQMQPLQLCILWGR